MAQKLLGKWIEDDTVTDQNIRLRASQWLRSRNNADDGDVNLIGVDGNDNLAIYGDLHPRTGFDPFNGVYIDNSADTPSATDIYLTTDGAFSGNDGFGSTEIAIGYNNNNDGDISSVFIFLEDFGTNTGDLVVNVYDDNSGEPGTLLATSDPISRSSVTTSDFYEFIFSSPFVVNQGTFYWLGLAGDSAYNTAQSTTGLGRVDNDFDQYPVKMYTGSWTDPADTFSVRFQIAGNQSVPVVVNIGSEDEPFGTLSFRQLRGIGFVSFQADNDLNLIADNGNLNLTTDNDGFVFVRSNSGNPIALQWLGGDSENGVGFKAPNIVTTDTIWILPDGDGTSGQVLATDGAGNLYWSSGGGGASTALDNLTTTAINAALLFDTDNAYDIGSDSFRVATIHANQFGDYINAVTLASGGTMTINSLGALNISASNGDSVVLGAEGMAGVTLYSIDATNGPPLNFNDGTNTKQVQIKAPDALTNTYLMTWPLDQGATGESLINDGAGNLSWGSSGASTALDNLTTTSINANLLPDSAIARDLGSDTLPWRFSYEVNVNTTLIEGWSNTTQDFTTFAYGQLIFDGPYAEDVTLISLNNGVNTRGIGIRSADNGAGDSKDILLSIGTATGTRGKIQIIDGSEGAAGDVWTSTDTAGKGAWQRPLNGWHKYTFSYADFSDASLSKTLNVFEADPESTIEGVMVHHTDQFSGTGISTVDIDVGNDFTAPNQYISTWSVIAAPGDTYWTRVIADPSILGPIAFSAGHNVTVTLTTTGANLDQLNVGSVDVYIKWSYLSQS